MKRLCINGSIFLALAALLYFGAFWVLSSAHVGGTPFIFRVSKVLNWKGGRSYLKFQEFDRNAHYDVITMGSSHADRGYDPRIFGEFGYSAFDLGTKAQSPMNSYYIVKHFLDQKNTGLLLLDVYKAAMETEGLESTADLTQNISNTTAAAGMAWGLKDPRGLNMLTLRAMMAEHPPFYLDSNYVGQGFSVNERTAAEDMEYTRFGPSKINERQWSYFVQLLQLCKERAIPVVLVDHPAPMETQPAVVSELYHRIVKIAKTFNVPFIDHTYDHDLDSRLHFYDHTHLNQAGVDIFNRLLVPEMKEIGVLEKN